MGLLVDRLNEPGLAAIIFVYVLTAIFFIDLEFRIIPDTIIIAGLLSGITLRLLESIQNWKDMLFGAFLCSGFLLLVSFAGRKLFHKESMGGGDIKLGFMIGIFLGFQNSSVGLFSAYLFAAVFEGGRSLLKGKMPKGEIPCGPYLALGALTGLFWGDDLVDLYKSWS